MPRAAPRGGGAAMSLAALPRIPRRRATVVPCYAGRAWPLLRLMLGGLSLVVLTLGIWRFWLRARLRRHYWSAIRIAGQPLEFTGTGAEMFLGFLIAVIVLAVVLGLANLVLGFLGMAYLPALGGFNLSILGAVPLMYLASYRARRYLMARTRWRGIRFGMTPGAAGYTVRGLGYLFLAAATLGLLVPLMDFRLRKFALDRTWFGDLRFTQEGSWLGFLRPWLWAWLPLAAAGLAVAGLAEWEAPGWPALAPVAVIGALAGGLGLVNYRVAARRYAICHTRLGQGVRFASALRTRRVIGIACAGALLVALIMLLVLALVSGALWAIAAMLGAGDVLSAPLRPDGAGLPGDARGLALAGAGVALYLIATIAGFALAEVLIFQPLVQYHVETLTISGAGELDDALQRPPDAMPEAGGLADVLDVGAGI
ncbi:MAG: DUF898 family protein [Alphaproteobacteria bacterium]|nr:MAG: DUF898 family protein [Alphaproteobacteria bacterium]